MSTTTTLAVDLHGWFGAERFTARSFYKAYHAGSRDDFPSTEDLADIRNTLDTASSIVERAPGPRGGEAWRLTPEGLRTALAAGAAAPRSPASA